MEKLKDLRKKKRVTQEEVAEAIGISTIMYSYIEQGRRRPSDKVKVKIAEYYGESVQGIFFEGVITDSDN